MNSTKKLTRSALLIALGIIVPYVFHSLGISGSVFLPMHFPPLLAGFLVGPVYAALVGAILPPLNFMISGMPPMPAMAFMIAELAIFGLVTGILYKKFGILISLIMAMLAGRIIYHTLFALIIEFENPLILIGSGIITGLPGIIGQLVLIPAIIVPLEKNLLNKRGSMKHFWAEIRFILSAWKEILQGIISAYLPFDF